MPYHTVTFQNCDKKTLHHYINWSAQHFESIIYSARCSATWQQKSEAQSRAVHMIADTMAQLIFCVAFSRFFGFQNDFCDLLSGFFLGITALFLAKSKGKRKGPNKPQTKAEALHRSQKKTHVAGRSFQSLMKASWSAGTLNQTLFQDIYYTLANGLAKRIDQELGLAQLIHQE